MLLFSNRGDKIENNKKILNGKIKALDEPFTIFIIPPYLKEKIKNGESLTGRQRLEIDIWNKKPEKMNEVDKTIYPETDEKRRENSKKVKECKDLPEGEYNVKIEKILGLVCSNMVGFRYEKDTGNPVLTEFKTLKCGIESTAKGDGISWGTGRPIRIYIIGDAVDNVFEKFREMKENEKKGSMVLEVKEKNFIINTYIKSLEIEEV